MSNATIKTFRDIPLKSGEVIPKGSQITFIGRFPKTDRTGVFNWNGRELRMRYTNVFKAPTMRSLERWTYDGIAESVLGNRVEPDGWDSYGAPSWLLVAGMA